MLDWLDHVASIATALVAVLAYGGYVRGRWKRRRDLERYLKDERERATGDDKGRRTILHLVAALQMTEAYLLQAAFGSGSIYTFVGVDPVTHRADCLLLQHRSSDSRR